MCIVCGKHLTAVLRSRVASGSLGEGGEADYDPSIPPEQQMVTFRTKDGEIKRISSEWQPLFDADTQNSNSKINCSASLTFSRTVLTT